MTVCVLALAFTDYRSEVLSVLCQCVCVFHWSVMCTLSLCAVSFDDEASGYCSAARLMIHMTESHQTKRFWCIARGTIAPLFGCSLFQPLCRQRIHFVSLQSLTDIGAFVALLSLSPLQCCSALLHVVSACVSHCELCICVLMIKWS